MGYERDRDARTRGAGAIAALDNVDPRRAAAARVRAQRTSMRDLKMAAVASGALGRVALGADHRAGAPSDRRPAPNGRGSMVDHRTGQKASADAPPPAAAPGTYGPATGVVYTTPPTRTAYPGMPTRATPEGGGAPVVPTPTPPSTPSTPSTPTTPTTPTPGATAAPGASGGGGGGGGGSGAGVKPSTAQPPIVETSTVSPMPDLPPLAQDNTRIYLVVGALGLAALLLLRRS